MPQETPDSALQTRQAPPAPCPAAPAHPRKEPREGQAGWKLTFFFQMPLTPGTASYSLLMASLQPSQVTAADPRPLPSYLPCPRLCRVWGRQPPQPGALQPPRSAAPRHGPRYVIPARATSLLLFPPIDLRQCPSSASLRAGWIPWGRAPPDPGPVCPPPPGPWGGGAPRADGGSGWHWGAGERDSRDVPGDLCPGVEVEGPHGAQHLDAPHVLRGGQDTVRAASSGHHHQPRAGNGEERRGEEEPGVSEKGSFHASSSDHTAPFGPPTPKCPQSTPSPHGEARQTHLRATACDALVGADCCWVPRLVPRPRKPPPPAPTPAPAGSGGRAVPPGPRQTMRAVTGPGCP